MHIKISISIFNYFLIKKTEFFKIILRKINAKLNKLPKLLSIIIIIIKTLEIILVWGDFINQIASFACLTVIFTEKKYKKVHRFPEDTWFQTISDLIYHSRSVNKLIKDLNQI